MNTQEEIMQAMQDYRRTQFGGWPWKDNDPVHGTENRRFARYPGPTSTSSLPWPDTAQGLKLAASGVQPSSLSSGHAGIARVRAGMDCVPAGGAQIQGAQPA
jgi:hypothetical protein